MKLTKETLERIIKEELESSLEEGDRIHDPKLGPKPITRIDPSLSIDQTDPNDGLFRIMDQVMDKALEMLGISKDSERYREVEDELMTLANEVVTERLREIDRLAYGVVSKYRRRMNK